MEKQSFSSTTESTEDEAISETTSSAYRSATDLVLTDETNTSGRSQNDLGDFVGTDQTFACQTRPESDTFGTQAYTVQVGVAEVNTDRIMMAQDYINVTSAVPSNDKGLEKYCKINLDSLIKLKESTRKLLYVLEEIQSKTHSASDDVDDMPKVSSVLKTLPVPNRNPDDITAADILCGVETRHLEMQASNLDEIYIEADEDDCSIFKRLRRKCICLNQEEYNDFVIHFNEDTKYFTSTLGELIKNVKILKKFLYIGGTYTRNALLFLNEGLTKSRHSERVEIILACSHADICNVFEENSIVTLCISMPCRNNSCGDAMQQALTAELLFKLSVVEEGRRYLTFSSKLTNDIKKLLRKESNKLSLDTQNKLNATLNLLNPPLTRHINVTYHIKAEEGIGNRTLRALEKYHMYMTLDEIFTHLDLLNNISEQDFGRKELMQLLPTLLLVFKRLILRYDDAQTNMTITHILYNLLTKKYFLKETKQEILPTSLVCHVATEPTPMKHAINQVPSSNKKHVKKNEKSKLLIRESPIVINKYNKPKLRLNVSPTRRNKSKLRLSGSPTKKREASKQKVAEEPSNQDNRSKKLRWETSPIHYFNKSQIRAGNKVNYDSFKYLVKLLLLKDGYNVLSGPHKINLFKADLQRDGMTDRYRGKNIIVIPAEIKRPYIM